MLELRTIDVEEAHRIGLVGEVVDQADFEDAFVDYCSRIAAAAPLTAQHIKQLAGAATQPAGMAKDQPTFTGR